MDLSHAIPLQSIDVTIHRYGGLPNDVEALTALELQASELEEALVLIRAGRSTTQLEEFFESPFRARKHYKGPSLRFSDATLLAFYGALERETAEAEAAPRDSLFAFYKDYCTCRFVGTSKDLRGTGWPFLVGLAESDLKSCRSVAHQAHASGAQSLLAPSARRTRGTCVPVFDKAALSEGKYIRTVRYEVDAGGKVVRVVTV